MVGNQHQHPQNHQPVQFKQNRELLKQKAHRYFTGRIGRTGPAREILRVRVPHNFLSFSSWLNIQIKNVNTFF